MRLDVQRKVVEHGCVVTDLEYSEVNDNVASHVGDEKGQQGTPTKQAKGNEDEENFGDTFMMTDEKEKALLSLETVSNKIKVD